MGNFKTRKRDGQVFPTDTKTSRDSGNPSYVGIDKSQIEYEPKSASDYIKNNSDNNPKKQGIFHNIGIKTKKFFKGSKPKTAKQEAKELQELKKERLRVEGIATLEKDKDVEEKRIAEAKAGIRASREKKTIYGKIKRVVTSEKTKKVVKKLLSDKPERKSSSRKSKKKSPKKKKSKEGLGGLFE